MPISPGTLEFALDLFGGLRATGRRMFGGLGLYAEGVMFALIDDDRIFLKTDAALQAALREEGSVAWIYTEARGPKAGVPQETSYWSLPEAACDDPEEACAWGRRAVAAALAIRAAKPAARRAPARGRGSPSRR